MWGITLKWMDQLNLSILCESQFIQAWRKFKFIELI